MPKIPGVNHLQAIRALEKAGFRVVREGKHTVMTNGDRLLTIPRHNPINAFTIDRYRREMVHNRKPNSTSRPRCAITRRKPIRGPCSEVRLYPPQTPLVQNVYFKKETGL